MPAGIDLVERLSLLFRRLATALLLGPVKPLVALILLGKTGKAEGAERSASGGPAPSRRARRSVRQRTEVRRAVA